MLGSVVKDRIADLNNHGCWRCGSVPLSGDNVPEEMGVLVVDYVAHVRCAGICVTYCARGASSC